MDAFQLRCSVVTTRFEAISMTTPRIVSLLPSATEIICLAGAEQYLVGRSHECDYPATITHLPVLTAAANGDFTTSLDVHNRTCSAVEQGKGLYSINESLLLSLQPTLIVTQSLCSVCSIDLVVVERVVARSSLNPKPTIISLNPYSMQDVLDDILRVGEAAGTLEQAKAAVQGMQQRLEGLGDLAKSLGPAKLPKVCFLEWTEPLFCGGHWTPALIELAGGVHPLNPPVPGTAAAGPSHVVAPEAVTELDPDVIIVCPCGLDLAMGRRESKALARQHWWRDLRAVKQGSVFLVDGNAHFNRPGPRLLEAAAFLVGVLHEKWELIPAGFAWELLQLLPEEAVAAADSTEPEADPTGPANPASESRPASLDLSDQRELRDCDGTHCAPNLSQDVEQAYEAALSIHARSYKDPITGYQCFMESALRERATCCGNRCRHCPYGHYKVQTARRGVRLNRVTQPTFASWGAAALPPESGTTLMVVACGQLPAAEAKLQSLQQAGQHVVVLVAVDPQSRAMWCSQPGSGAACAHGCTPDAAPGSEPLALLMDWCMKQRLCMMLVPVSGVRAQREGAAVASWVVQQAVSMLGSATEDRQAVKVNGLVGAEGDSVPCLPWLPASVNRALGEATWSGLNLKWE